MLEFKYKGQVNTYLQLVHNVDFITYLAQEQQITLVSSQYAYHHSDCPSCNTLMLGVTQLACQMSRLCWDCCRIRLMQGYGNYGNCRECLGIHRS